ncbi:MAG: SGNH/GDSL hydrolase family protein [Calditrichaceae bacterium]
MTLMKKFSIRLILLLSLLLFSYAQSQNTSASERSIKDSEKTLNSQWNGKRVAYLGDSMTQKPGDGSTVYWEYLDTLLGIKPFVYGISGHQWNDIYDQAVKLRNDRGSDIDAIFIFAGTNDYNDNVPMGKFFAETTKQTNHDGQNVTRKYRSQIYNDSTFCGRINKVMSYLKTQYPLQQVILYTPLHRGFAKFSDHNIQPEESFCNGQSLYLEDYVNSLKEAALNWAVPIIDLYSLSGLYPLSDSYTRYFRNSETDRLHLNSEGNYRLAKTMQYQLLTIPSTFVGDR